MTVTTLSSTSLVNTDVTNIKGEDLGKIEDIMIDLDTGRVSYAVLSFGGFLGFGNKLFAIPWEALSVNTNTEKFVLDVDKDTLKNMEGFEKDNWPDMGDREWGSRVYGYFGYEPYWNVAL